MLSYNEWWKTILSCTVLYTGKRGPLRTERSTSYPCTEPTDLDILFKSPLEAGKNRRRWYFLSFLPEGCQKQKKIYTEATRTQKEVDNVTLCGDIDWDM